MEEQTPHKRRVRYSGTHPKGFHEKYKEHNPEKYAGEVEKIKAKGNTPAGMHISICVSEILEFLQIKPGQKGLDATLGYGGHTSKMLEQLQGNGHVYGLDIDPIEMVKTKARLEEKGYGSDVFTAIHTNFANLSTVAKEHGPFDFLLADLGVSSMQIDDPSRGFSFKREGPLDLRLNPQAGISAAQWLETVSVEDLEDCLLVNSDEPYSEVLAQEMVAKKPQTTGQLKAIVESVIDEHSGLGKARQKDLVKKTCQRVFQALRMEVNQEFDVLCQFLDSLPDAMAPGGRIAILTFHSGEDRLVKKAFQAFHRGGQLSEISTEIIRPSPEECRNNPRATSTKMRWAIKA